MPFKSMNELSGASNPAFSLNEIDRAETGELSEISKAELKELKENSHKVEQEFLRNKAEDSISSAENGVTDHTSFTCEKQSGNNIDPTPTTLEDDYSLLSFFNKNESVQKFKGRFQTNKPTFVYASRMMASVLALSAYIAYFIAVLVIKTDNENDDYWCSSDGLLIIITVIALIVVIYNVILKHFSASISKFFLNKRIIIIQEGFSKYYNYRYTVPSIYLLVFCCAIIFLVIDTAGDRSRLISAMGILVFILLGFLFSTAPRKIVWRPVIWGIGLQFVFGLLILRWPVGRKVIKCLGDKVNTFLSFTDRGSSFLYGPLVSEFSIFAFKILSVLLFVGMFVKILYYYGVVQWIVLKLGWLLQVTVGTTACESVNAAANIFLGMAETPLLIKPYLPLLTNSELHAVMTGGFATIAGTVLAAFVSFGVDVAHLLSASVMSAPAAMAYSKLLYPEVGKSRTKAGDIKFIKCNEANVLHAGLEGVTSVIPLVAAIGANLIAFLALIAFVDTVMSWPCELIGLSEGTCSLSNIMGYAFIPIAWLMGVPWVDCYNVGQLIGTKTFINTFVAYLKLGEFIKNSTISHRSITIATYAICGFGSIAGIGIQLGVMGAMIPERKGVLSRIVFRAMVAGSVACFLTACVAGTLVPSDTVHFRNLPSDI